MMEFLQIMRILRICRLDRIFPVSVIMHSRGVQHYRAFPLEIICRLLETEHLQTVSV